MIPTIEVIVISLHHLWFPSTSILKEGKGKYRSKKMMWRDKENGTIVPKFNFGRNCANFFVFGRILPRKLFSAKNLGVSMNSTSSRMPDAKSEFGCQKYLLCTRCAWAGWRNICELPWFLRKLSVPCYLLHYSRLCKYFILKNFLSTWIFFHQTMPQSSSHGDANQTELTA